MIRRAALICAIVTFGLGATAAIGYWLSLVEEANDVRRSVTHVPAACAWKEIERDGDWQQTCDDNQKRLQR